MTETSVLLNYIDGEWVGARTATAQDVVDPATAEILGRVPMSGAEDVARAVAAARAAFLPWRRMPPTERVQYLFRLKGLLDEEFEALSRTITRECGKTLAEARGEMRRAIDNVEVACGIPTLMQGDVLEDVTPGVDEMMLRQPVGVCAIITPFNFPGMIPFWFLPYALACGNPCIVKPSERVPLTMQRVFQLLDDLALPRGVVNLVNGAREAADALLDHPEVQAVSFVGSTAVAKYVYARASAQGKRVQAAGGAKNPMIVLPDADIDLTTRVIAESAFGCAGQRCLAGSIAVTVGAAGKIFGDAIADAAEDVRVGYGLDEATQMGPVITPASRTRIEAMIGKGAADGAHLRVDGRGARIPGYERGNFLRPTVLEGVDPSGEIAGTEIFGPVLSLIQVDSVEQAIALVNRGRYGNMACLFTRDGAAARQFRHEAEAGNIGINIGVAAPMACFPFSGWKDSFFGTLHGQARHAVEFFTQTKVVIERWR